MCRARMVDNQGAGASNCVRIRKGSGAGEG